MGVVVPTVIFGLLFVLPWLDRNPYRLARRRTVAVLAGIVFSAAIVVLTYMGTPTFGIETPPAQDILSHFAPATEPGPVRELPWDELEMGPGGEMKTYFVSYPKAWESDPRYADPERYEFITGLSSGGEDEFHQLLMEFKAEVENQPKLIAPVYDDKPLALMTIQEYQPRLKWVEMRINWDELVPDPDTGEPTLSRLNEQQAVLAVHQEAAYSE